MKYIYQQIKILLLSLIIAMAYLFNWWVGLFTTIWIISLYTVYYVALLNKAKSLSPSTHI